jgi:hypothetical protein
MNTVWPKMAYTGEKAINKRVNVAIFLAGRHNPNSVKKFAFRSRISCSCIQSVNETVNRHNICSVCDVISLLTTLNSQFWTVA